MEILLQGSQINFYNCILEDDVTTLSYILKGYLATIFNKKNRGKDK